MSGADPNGKRFGKKGEPTEPFQPEGAGGGRPLPKGLPKIPGITLHYEIARGGMGVVYSGRQDFLDRRVAVKFLSMDLGGEAFAQRFQREAKILAGISHPNIVGCHMADTTPEGQSYLVMEFCDGPSLKAWITENGPVEPIAAIRMIRASAMALAHAHQSDIIHRDVKPENILLESVTSTALDIRFPFTPKIVDLGLARMTHEQVGMGLTSPGSVMGTPSTMSPEQFDDPDSVDFRSDIYGLGCCLYEMLVGHPAFRGSKLTDIVVRKREATGPNPCDERPSLPVAVGAFTQRLLASSRDDRPPSYRELDQEANELMTALLASRGNEPAVEGESELMDRTIESAQSASRPGAPTTAFGDISPGTDPGAELRTNPMGTNPLASPRSGTQPAQPGGPAQPANTAPGMLNTGELNFLSEGGAAASAEPAAPAFQEPGTSPTNPIGAVPGNSKKGLYIGVGAVVAVAVVLAIAFGMGGDEPGSNGGAVGGNSGGNAGNNSGNPPAVTNTAPTIESIKMLVAGKESQDATIGLGGTFELVADATGAAGIDLDYEWKWPSKAMHPMSQTGDAKIKLTLDDGLPGVAHVVDLVVSDGGSEQVRRSFTVTVGKCDEQMPLIAYSATGAWEKRSGIWREIMDAANPSNQGVSGRVSRSVRAVLGTALDTDAFWEWEGTLAPSEMGDGEASALVAIKFGDKGYALSCAIAKDETEWTVEVLEQVPGQNAWRPLSPPNKSTWTQPADSDGTTRGWFGLRRVADKMSLQVGEYARPAPVPNQPLAEPTISRQPAVEVELTARDREVLTAGGQLNLVVSKGRCVFRATRR